MISMLMPAVMESASGICQKNKSSTGAKVKGETMEQDVIIEKLKDSIFQWSQSMQGQLISNAHKGTNWKRDSVESLLVRVQQEIGEMIDAMHEGKEPRDVFKEAADVANMIFMAADAYQARWCPVGTPLAEKSKR